MNPRERLILRRKAAKFPRVRPDHGARLELKLTQGSETRADYTLIVLTSDAELSAQVSLDAAADSLQLASWQGGVPPAWLESYAHALLRSVLRTKNSDGDWPRRLTRWRPGPKA